MTNGAPAVLTNKLDLHFLNILILVKTRVDSHWLSLTIFNLVLSWRFAEVKQPSDRTDKFDRQERHNWDKNWPDLNFWRTAFAVLTMFVFIVEVILLNLTSDYWNLPVCIYVHTCVLHPSKDDWRPQAVRTISVNPVQLRLDRRLCQSATLRQTVQDDLNLAF